ncbi:MAG TPA: HD domain-containing phosphohydrolase [Vicinamibacterales bacterium]|nr:HD domain-containing phosphohydrolase [Vicinamibacterales bacterium]
MKPVTRRRSDRTTFLSLPMVAQFYVAGVTLLGLAALAVSVARLGTDRWLLFAGLLALTVATSAVKIELPLGRGASNLSLAHAVNFWALWTLGAAPTVIVAAVSAAAQSVLRTSVANPPHRVLFSIATLALTVWLAALPLSWALGPDSTSLVGLLRAVAVVAPLYFLINTGLVAAAVAMSTQQNVFRVWQRNFLWSAPSFFAGAVLAAAATSAWERGLIGWLLLLAAPAYLVFRSYHTVVSRLREEQEETRRAMDVQLATTEALALAIEAKGGCTPEHVRSIQRYAGMLAEAAGMSDEDIQAVRAAALLHDIGNMAVPEHILAKPDALTPEEFERVKIHPRVGAEILRDVPFGGPVAELVLCHHERWDGLGYPAGLRGDAIPLGARVLTIADVFSTLQTPRPYRNGFATEQEAIQTLRELAGQAFDPTLVDVLIARLSKPAEVLGEDAAPAATERAALLDISEAHREEQVLYEIAQALGSSLGVDEAMALIRDKVNRLVPFVTCALFLGDDDRGFTCRYAHGPGTEALLKWSPKSWSELSLRLPACADGRDGRGEDLVAVLPCRLIYEGRLIGAIAIYHTAPTRYTDEHRRVLGRVSEQAAAVIHNSTRYEQTRHESQTDALTGLPNRRSFERQLRAGLTRVLSAQSSASLVVLDLDRLKEINDTYGHEAGDRALRAIGAVLRATVRETDLCARFAGDEFVIVLWDCSPEHELRRITEVQNAVAAYPFEPRQGVRVPLSISAGCARFPQNGVTLDDLLISADERMYQDKAARRGRTSSRSRDAQLEGERA